MRQLIDKKLIKIVRADNTVEYKIKYIYKGLFKNKEVFDKLVFTNKKLANIFFDISVGPSEKIKSGNSRYSDDYFNFYSQNGDFGNAVYKVTSKYDEQLEYWSSNNINDYNCKRRTTEASIVFCPELDQGSFILVHDAVYNLRENPKYYVLYEANYLNHNTWVFRHCAYMIYDNDLNKSISKFLENQKSYIEGKLKEKDDKAKAELLHNTIVSNEVLSSKNDKEEKLDINIIKTNAKNLEIQGLYSARNEMIQKELERIDKYRKDLITLLHT